MKQFVFFVPMCLLLLGCFEDRRETVEKKRCNDKTLAYTLATSLVNQRFRNEQLYFPPRSEVNMKTVAKCGQEIAGYFVDSSGRKRSYQATVRYNGGNYWALEELSLEEF